MPKRSSTAPSPRDVNQLATPIVAVATSETLEPTTEPAEKEKNPAAVALGRLGGRKGGVARAAKLSAKKRAAIAQKAARTRWAKKQERS